MAQGFRFRHTRLSRETINRRQDQKATLTDPWVLTGFHIFRPKDGLNTVRLLPPTWHDNEGWPAFNAHVHYSIGPDNGTYLCTQRMLREPCPVCEEENALKEEGDTDGAKAIYARKARIAWVVDRKDQKIEDPQAWMFGYTIDEEMAGRCLGENTGEEIDPSDPDNGYDLTFKRFKDGGFNKTGQLDFARRESPLDRDPEWYDYFLRFITNNPIPDVLQYYSYDHIYDVLHGRRASTRDADRDRDRGRPPRSSRDLDDEIPF